MQLPPSQSFHSLREDKMGGRITGGTREGDVRKRENGGSHTSSKQVIEIHALHWHGENLFCCCLPSVSPLSQCFSSSLFLFVSVRRHLYWKRERGRTRERFWLPAYLLLTMVPLRPSKQGGYTYTHTCSCHRGEQLGSVLHWKPHFPSIRRTGRQLGVTPNPFPHVSFLTRASLLLSFLSVCCSLYLMPRTLKAREASQALGKCRTMIWL